MTTKPKFPALIGLSVLSLGGVAAGCDSKPSAGTSATARPSWLPSRRLGPKDTHPGVALGGAVAPLPASSVPKVVPPPKAETPKDEAPQAKAQAAPEAAVAPSPVGHVASSGDKVLMLEHHHPPGEACTKVSNEEVRRALADLNKP